MKEFGVQVRVVCMLLSDCGRMFYQKLLSIGIRYYAYSVYQQQIYVETVKWHSALSILL